MDSSVDKLSIKSLLFTKAVPNYQIPISTNGYKVHGCIDCGDKFLFESSLEVHISRKSMLITYMCQYCGQLKLFHNRCNLLCHIRSHSFKTATINVQDLKVEPLPLGLYKQYAAVEAKHSKQQPKETQKKVLTTCFECAQTLPSVGFTYKDRASHFMQYTNEIYTCPVCLFTVPTICALRAHLRFHLKYPPYYCPECGINIINKNVHYPFNHDCEGFNMMRATARVKCSVSQCQLYHPNEFKGHMKENHIKKVFKCPVCVVACFNEVTMDKHLKGHVITHLPDLKALIFYQCELCPGRLVLQNHIDNHLHTHVNSSVYPCWTCATVFKEVFALIDHHVKKHDQNPDIVKNMLTSMVNESENQVGKPKRIYRVVKRCDQCKKNFSYKCKYDEIAVLPNECPYKCTTKLRTSVLDGATNQLTCHMCNVKMSCDWKDITKHYATAHKNHRCLEPKLLIKKLDVKKYITQNNKKVTKRNSRKRRPQPKAQIVEKEPTTKVPVSDNSCGLCDHTCESKEMLETHFRTHRDPCMAYQCLECGQSFVVKPSFSKHLVLEHSIYDAEKYINSKQCYNETALDKHQNTDIPMEPLKDNQCTICREQFENPDDLEKHFRVHGMAFLLKNTSKGNKVLPVNENMSNKDVENTSNQEEENKQK